MSNFNVISKKFFNEYRNGVAFGDDLTEFTDRLQGNEGEIVQILEQIEINTIANARQVIDMTFFENSALSYCTFVAPLINFVDLGFYNGATLQIEFDGNVITVGTCEGITGNGNKTIKIDSIGRSALLAAGIVDGDQSQSIVIKVTSPPEYLLYKYGLNPNSSTAPNYVSPYGGQQNYQLKAITNSFQTMTWIGSLEGSNLGTVRLKFDTTNENFKHLFTIEHTFKIPYYIQGQIVNLNGVTNPPDLLGANSLKYGNGFFFGGNTNVTVAIFEDLGGVGNVGYFDENFNGFPKNYTIENLSISNSANTGTLEGTLVNTVTFDVVSSAGNWTAAVDELIFTHTKLPTQAEYFEQNTDFDDIWLFENIKTVEGAAPISNLGGMLSLFEFSIDGGDPTRLNVRVFITFDSARQLLIDENVDFLLYVTTAHNDLSDPDLMDRVNLIVNQGEYTNDNDVPGLVTKWTPLIHEEWDGITGSKFFTNFDGWDGDFIGFAFSFDTQAEDDAIVKDFKVHLALDNGTDFFPLLTIPIPLTNFQIGTVDVDGINFQILNKDFNASFNMPDTVQLNQIELEAIIPTSPAPTTQSWEGRLGFRVPWRDWIQNLNVPASFIDYSEPQNGQNEKTSNYSGVSGFKVKAIIELNMGSSTGADTTYFLLSDDSEILDFDDAGGGTFSAVTKLYDEDGDITDNIFIDQNVRIEIEFSHTLGTLVVGDTWGRIWIEADQTTLQPYDLSTELDLNDINSPLQPTDTLATGNTQFVEIVSVNNLVTLICQTNRDNLTAGLVYNLYGRLGDKL